MNKKRINTRQYADYGKFTRRTKMTDTLRRYGIRDRRILDAFMTLPRHIFIPQDGEASAYADSPVRIGFGQTISQPYVVALMLEELKIGLRDRVLEIGSGSGYVTALLSLLAARVTGIERIRELADRSRKILAELQMKNAAVICGDGYSGYPRNAPYDAILVSAAPPELPDNLFSQLREGGRLVIPVGQERQLLKKYTKVSGEIREETITEVRFVPLRHA